MSRLAFRRTACGALALITIVATLALGGAPSAATTAADQPPAPTAPVTAIVSPLASPSCQASGSATLLVPILSGAVTEKVPIPQAVSISDIVLTALGPIFIVCGDLPAAPGSRCNLDNQIAGVWPAQIGTVYPSPNLAGDVVDSADALKTALGLPPDAATPTVVQCEIPGAAQPVQAPAAPPAAPATPLVAPGIPTPGSRTGSAGNASPSAPSATAAPTPRAVSSRVAQLATSLARRVPGGLLLLQLLAAALLALVLVSSWLTSWRVARANVPSG